LRTVRKFPGITCQKIADETVEIAGNEVPKLLRIDRRSFENMHSTGQVLPLFYFKLFVN
jgi:hypothetical protein